MQLIVLYIHLHMSEPRERSNDVCGSTELLLSFALVLVPLTQKVCCPFDSVVL